MMPTVQQVSLQLTKLAPSGALHRALATGARKFWMGVADELVRVYDRVAKMISEAHPLSCDETLSDWETEYGLPDECVTATQTIAERKSAVAARLGSAGGQSRAYYVSVAAGMGLSVSITEEVPFLVGLSGCGDGVGGDNYYATWTVTAPASTSTAQRQLLECTFARLKPAHTVVNYQYV